MLSVTGTAQAARLPLLALQLHDCRAGTDHANRFLERDALQGSISRNGATDIFIGLPREGKKGSIRNAADRRSKMKKSYAIFLLQVRQKSASFQTSPQEGATGQESIDVIKDE